MTYQFGAFEFDARSLELRKNGRLVALEPQPARALALLLSRANEVVSRDELKLAVWGPDTHVDFDRGLAYCLSAIRQALGDKGDNPRFVQTLPRRGYCFVAPVRLPVEGAPSEQEPRRDREPAVSRSRARVPLAVAALAMLAAGLAWFATMRAGDARAVIAVSVFDNETGDPAYDRLVSNLSDTIVVHLTGLAPARLAVIGNAEILRRPRNIRNLKALASAIHADYAVLGQLQRTGTGFQFVTHLIRLSDETHVRAQRIQVSPADLSTLEPAVIAELEQAVGLHVLGRGRTAAGRP